MWGARAGTKARAMVAALMAFGAIGMSTVGLSTVGLSTIGMSTIVLSGAARAADMRATFAVVGDVTAVPYGWADFCGRRPAECRVEAMTPVDLALNPKSMRVLKRVNSMVNAAIEPVSNMDHWGTLLDHWDYPTDGKGDCKIYALEKRRILLAQGFPRQALLMTIVRDLEGNGHTILTVKTDHGDFILDNMVEAIRAWDDTGYSFVKRQSQSDPNVWVSVGQAAAPGTTANVSSATIASLVRRAD